ncbi:autotransporter assembly complex protein TamA [Candidatus Palibaumannia cicadellinicola]|uniref:autotransporter assembly complex protein TamA n=1 Tax=Candidatus Palibaumannia cicadellinicola TaxID=186490 RepID=UPI00117BA80C|nr:autotransporter assembly complex family protein [Candidatus Baumannia cicadellinicola]MBS0032530.1 outer membrane protein assembly factor [Candidatus Baumannia cicadellinicola]MCJ7461948.1 autotransporter assembly complex protein TamA [Candidatus Baumannia cicadellinicola]MCJ7462536.1 autotransporter assembly complex protein TamA [Candidatus Baumannia cicadellinicola]
MILCALFFAQHTYSANVCLQLTGLNGNLLSQVRNRLSSLSIIDANEDNMDATDYRFKSLLNEAVREELRTLGYYSPIIYFELQRSSDNQHYTIITHVNPGKQTIIAGVNVVLHGDACYDLDYQQLVDVSKKELGTVLNHTLYYQFKTGLSELALSKGYFNAKFEKSNLNISPPRYQAYWDIHFNSGKRYRFGKLRFHGAQICEDYLQKIGSIINFGDPYNANLLSSLQNRLIASNWFESVVISPDLEKVTSGSKDNILNIDARVKPQLHNQIKSSIGYTLNLGLQLKTTWDKTWLNKYGHSIKTIINLQVPEQAIEMQYKVPFVRDYREQYYMLQGGFNRCNLNNIEYNSVALNLMHYKHLSNSWQHAINLRGSITHFPIQSNDDYTTILVYPSILIEYMRTSNGLMPTIVNKQHYSVSVSNTAWNSDITFLIWQIHNVWIRTLVNKHRFIMSSNIGWIDTRSLELVPPSIRFFAGGYQSIRGYKYQSISPKNNYGKLNGALKLALGSLEYQQQIADKLWGTFFIDSGEAVNDITQNNIKTGTGIGIRWESPAGLIRFDIARPLADKHEHGLQLYIGLGSAL